MVEVRWSASAAVFVVVVVSVWNMEQELQQATISGNSRQQQQQQASNSSNTSAPRPKSLYNPMDPNHTPRLTRFTNMSAFPLPEFHGCNRTLCHFSNVCFSTHDNMLVFDVPTLETNSSSNESSWYRYKKVTSPRRPRLVPHGVYSQLENVYFASDMFVMNCWRQKEGKFNPAHTLMGFGKLLAHASRYREQEETQTFDFLVYHQCTPVEGVVDGKSVDWPWGEMVDNIIWEEAVDSGIIQPPMHEARIFLPYTRRYFPTSNAKDVFICGKSVYQEPFSVATYLGSNNGKVVARWRHILAEKDFGKDSIAELSEPCSPRKLRVAIWKRTEGSALRLLTNMESIEQLVGEFTDVPLQVLSTSSDTSPEDQIAVFRSFDVLITPHGSHLANMVFSPHNTTIIEVSATKYDDAPRRNGVTFLKHWINSYGHVPFNNTELVRKLPVCQKGFNEIACPKQTRLQFIQSDLVVNITTLRGDLEEAKSALCPR